jgi:hypothetical protein
VTRRARRFANLNGFLPALFPALALLRGHRREFLLQLDK